MFRISRTILQNHFTITNTKAVKAYGRAGLGPIHSCNNIGENLQDLLKKLVNMF